MSPRTQEGVVRRRGLLARSLPLPVHEGEARGRGRARGEGPGPGPATGAQGPRPGLWARALLDRPRSAGLHGHRGRPHEAAAGPGPAKGPAGRPRDRVGPRRHARLRAGGSLRPRAEHVHVLRLLRRQGRGRRGPAQHPRQPEAGGRPPHGAGREGVPRRGLPADHHGDAPGRVPPGAAARDLRRLDADPQRVGPHPQGPDEDVRLPPHDLLGTGDQGPSGRRRVRGHPPVRETGGPTLRPRGGADSWRWPASPGGEGGRNEHRHRRGLHLRVHRGRRPGAGRPPGHGLRALERRPARAGGSDS